MTETAVAPAGAKTEASSLEEVPAYHNLGITESINEAIDKLDLGPIKFKLMLESGENWSLAQVNSAEIWYKRFLALNLKYPKLSIVPNKVIDEFWHLHILDTMKYQEDCQSVFGHFLHHFPYFGMRGEEDAKNLENAFEETKKLFLKEFGESISELRKLFSSSDEGAGCEGTECGGTACGSTNCDSSEFNPSRPSFQH